MPPKKKEEIIDLSTLPPWFPIAVFLNWQSSEQNAQNIAKAVQDSTFGIKRHITREEIIDYGKKNGLYLDPTQDKQKKDKNAAEIPTELTPELMAKIFAKFYEEINLEGRKEKKAILDAIAEGKDPALLKKADKDKKGEKKDSKKPGQKDAKNKEEEDQKEEPPLDKLIHKECDFVYFFADYPSTKEEIVELSKQNTGMDLVLRITEKIIEHKSFEESELLGKKEEEDHLRNRLDNFVENQSSEGKHEENAQDDVLQKEKQAKDLEFLNQNQKVFQSFKEARAQSSQEEVIRNTVIREIICEFDEEFSLEETLKNITLQIFEEICGLSLNVVGFREWIKTQKVAPVKQPQKVVAPIPSEIVVPTDEQLKSPSTKVLPKTSPRNRPASKEAGKDLKKETKDDKKKTTASKKELEEPKKEEITLTSEPPKKEEKEPEISFNYYEKQLNPLKEENLNSNALLEAILDEISHNSQSSQKKAEGVPADLTQVFQAFDNNVLKPLNTIQTSSEAPLQEDYLSNPYQYIIHEADNIALKTQNNHLSNQESLDAREHQTFDKIKLPGFDRHLMPSYPEKSESLRKAEKSQIHPFLSFEKSEFERFQLLELFEKLFQEKANREWNFGDRIYEERLNPNLLRQKLYQALLFDPEIYCQYLDQEDALLLGVYFVNPPGRVIRKKWTCPWKVLPNIENWILHFKENENNLSNALFYNLDYQLVENLHEVTKFMYPNDQSVILCSQFNVGDQSHNFYRVLKENFTFGVRKATDQTNPNSEFWAVFTNQTKLLAEVEKISQKAEGLQSKEGLESNKVDEVEQNFETLNENSKETNKDLETILTSQNNETKQLTSTITHVYGATFTLTLENGLIVKFLTNGDILQTIAKSKKQKEGKYFDEIIKEQYTKEDLSEQEKSRLITGKGSVIRYMRDGSIQILYANGNYAVHKKNSGSWITTNNKGLRKGRKIRDNSEFELDPIPSARKTDPETGCKILIREDKVMIVQYPDGTTYTTHKDGTKFLTSADSNTIVIEKQDFATVKIKYDPVKARMGTILARGSSSAYQGFDNIMDRSFDGRVTETFIPDGCRVVGYKEKQELEGYEVYETSNIHLLYEPEGSVFRFKSDGEVIIVSANDRRELNENGENREVNDIDYFLQLFGTPEERKNGVYTAELVKNLIWTRDNEGNYFSISSSGETKGKIAVSFDLNQNINEADKPIPQDVPDGLYIDQENNFLPPPEKVLFPRLFLIRNDNSGSEFLNDLQLKHYLRIKETNPKCTKTVENEVPGYVNCQSLSFLTSLSNFDKDVLKHIFVKIPKNVDIIPQTENIKEEPLRLRFTYRNLIKFLDLDETKRQRLHEDIANFAEWKKNQTKESNEFGLKERSEEHKEKEYSIQQKIVESRRTTYKQEGYQECLDKIGQNVLPEIAENITNQLLSSRKRKETEHVIIKTRKSIIKQFRSLEKPPVPQEEIYPLGIKFSEADWRDINFAGNYYQTYPGKQFEQTLPKYDIEKILEEKNKLRKTQHLIKQDETLKEETRKYSLSKSNIDQSPESPARVQKEKEYPSPNYGTKTITSPSWNQTRDRLKKEREQKESQEAENYHQSKLPKFDVYGEERKHKEFVPSLLRPIAQRELNTKYITVESVTDRRVKISSMAKRLHVHAPPVNEVRNQGSHTFSTLALDKKYDRESLVEKKDLMITAAFADSLKRDLLISPVIVSFGKIKTGAAYEKIVKVQNEDALPQRITIKQPSSPYSRFITVTQKNIGPIAMGVSKELIVTIKAYQDNLGPVNCAFEVVSKHDIYKIQVTGEIISEYGEETDKLQLKQKLPPLSSEEGGSTRKHLTDNFSEDASFPTFKYDRNTKLDMNLHTKKRNEDSYQSEN